MLALLSDIGQRVDLCKQLALSFPADLKIERLRKQHAGYATILQELGARVEPYHSLPGHPSDIIVERAVILLPEVAIANRDYPSDVTREFEKVISHLAQYSPVQRIRAGRIDGRDILRVGDTIYVANSSSADADSIESLTEIVDHYGYAVRTIELRDCEHLKSACTFVPPDFVIVNPAWVNVQEFSDWKVIKIDPGEPLAANTLTIFGTTLVNAAYPKTEKRLQAAGLVTRLVDISELEKVGANLTGLSVILESRIRKRTFSRTGITPIKALGAPTTSGHSAQAVVHKGLIYVSGQLPMNPAGDCVASGSVEAQTEQTLNNLAAILAAGGSSLARVLRMTLYLTDTKLLDRVNHVIARVLNGHRPAQVLVPVKTLPSESLIEIEVIAAVADH